MPANTRELRRRIKATKSIKQITKAMEMIAASKMRKAQMAALASRPYANLAWEMLASLARGGTVPPQAESLAHPLLLKSDSEKQKSLVLVVAPNRGLCGSLPGQVITKASKAGSDPALAVQYVTVGRKAQRALLREKKPTLAHFDGFETQPTITETRPIARLLIDAFTEGRVTSVEVVYANFISTLQYGVQKLQLLPVGEREPELGSVHETETAALKFSPTEFLFEPSPNKVLDELLPRLVELQIYQIILEGLASEHSARMVTMQNASSAADDLIEDFTLTYNSARQAAITEELADITGGRLALQH